MAYNVLDRFKIDCPVCGARSEQSELQIKTAATYMLADDVGRFALRLYALGDKLAWLPRSDPCYLTWLEGADRADKVQDSAEEDLFVKCWGCRSDLMLTIRFESLYIVPFVEVRAHGKLDR